MLSSGACTGTRQNQVQVGSPTTVQVENQSFLDVTVYVFEGGRRVRLGMVPGVSTRTLEIPERMIFGISLLRFQVDPLGSNRTPMSQEITVAPGQELRLVVPPTVR